MTRKKLMATVFCGAFFASGALAAEPSAPPSNSPEIENITVTGVTGADAGGGLMVEEKGTKQKSTVTTDFIATQAPTSNPVQLLRYLPGANVSSSDAFGVQQSDITVRGLGSTQIGVSLEGMPLNDSGSFAIYPSEWIDSENLSSITLSHGSSELDSPFVYATGGSINITMNEPTHDFRTTVGQSVGSHSAIRSYVRLDSGDLNVFSPGDWRMFLSGSYYSTNHYTGPGSDEREHLDFKAVHDWGADNRIAPVIIVNRGILDKYYGPSLAAWNTQQFKAIDYPATLINSVTSSAAPNIATDYYKLVQNPFIDVIASMPTSIRILDNLTYEATPYFWYGFGNGGAGAYVTSANTLYYGTTKLVYNGLSSPYTVLGSDKVFYSPSITETYRPGLTNKFTLDLDNQKLVAGYWIEYSAQHQWKPVGMVDAGGAPLDIWGTKVADLLLMPNGNKYTAYDETAYSWNNVIFFGDTIGFWNERLQFDVGVKQSWVSRDADNHELATPDLALWPSQEIKQTRSETLPTFAVRYHITGDDTVFANWVTNFRTPNTFPTFFGSLNNPVSAAVYDLPTPNLKDERSQTAEVGWRHQDGLVDTALSAFAYDFHDRQFTINVPIPQSSGYFTDDINIGTTHSYGVDFEIGFHPVDHWRPYFSAEYLKTRQEGNIPTFGTLGTNRYFSDSLPTAGHQVPRSPNDQFALGLAYDNAGLFGNFGLKYVGKQYSTFMNDETMPEYYTADLTLGYRFDQIGPAQKPEIRLNVVNLTDVRYLSGVQGVYTNVKSYTGINGSAIGPSSSPYYYVGAPFEVMMTVTTKF